NAETHANINYDVSYVDNMMLPVAMEALDVPVGVNADPNVVNPPTGDRLPFGWIGSGQTVEQFQALLATFLGKNPDANTNNNGLGQYFATLDPSSNKTIYNGWSQYVEPQGDLLKVPSGQAAFSDSPLTDSRSAYVHNQF